MWVFRLPNERRHVLMYHFTVSVSEPDGRVLGDFGMRAHEFSDARMHLVHPVLVLAITVAPVTAGVRTGGNRLRCIAQCVVNDAQVNHRIGIVDFRRGRCRSRHKASGRH